VLEAVESELFIIFHSSFFIWPFEEKVIKDSIPPVKLLFDQTITQALPNDQMKNDK